MRKDGMKISIACMLLKLSIGIIFAGWIALWFLKPTSFWKRSWTKFRLQTSTCFLGVTGSLIYVLVYSLPIILVAVLGPIYFYLGRGNHRNSGDGRDRRRMLEYFWRYPVLFVNGTLGIISALELSLLLFFIGLLLWSFGMYISHDFKTINAAAATMQMGNIEVWQSKLGKAGLRLGHVGFVCLSFLFFPVSRGSVLLRIVGLYFEATVKYHIWIGNVMMTLFTAHGLCYTALWISEKKMQELIRWDKVGISNIAGEMALVAGLMMWVTALRPVRRNFFEVFYYTHHLYLVFVILCIMHVGERAFSAVLPGVFLFLLDRFLRLIQSRRSVRVHSVRLLPCQAVELAFLKQPDLEYTSTSIIFVNIPLVSRWQWHPFTITSTSSADNDRLTVLIKNQGDWTRRLYDVVSTLRSNQNLQAAVEGPYGPPSNFYLRYTNLILISGGSGITPFSSILRELTFQKDVLGSGIPSHVMMICVFKIWEDISMLHLLLPPSNISSVSSPIRLQIQVFVTRSKAMLKSGRMGTSSIKPDHSTSSRIRSVYFSGENSDLSSSSLSGTSSNIMWQAGITGTSFLLYLVIVSFIDRLYIYRIDHNTYKVYPWWARGLFIILSIFMALTLTTTTATTIWNRRQSFGRQIQNVGTPSPSWPCHLPQELECLNAETMLEASNVHYGQRPNFQEIFASYSNELAGANVGVLVCGPQGMRDSVASVCKQYSATRGDTSATFTFHSINFSV